MDAELLTRLRSGDEEAFVMLVSRYQRPLLRLACSMVPSQAVAEEAVQDTWMGVVRGIDRFEGRSSFKTWLFRILVNRARRRAPRNLATHPSKHFTLSTRPVSTPRANGPIRSIAGPRRARAVSTPPLGADPPIRPGQPARPSAPGRPVLRDVEGLSNDEACAVLGISIGNQRILLHRGGPACASSSKTRSGRTDVLSLRRKDIVCQQAVELVTDYLEGALSRRDRRRFEAHLQACPNCTAYLEQIRMTIGLAGTIEPDDLTPEAQADLTELYRRWRSEE